MTFTVRKTSDWECETEVNIDSLEQLMEFCKENERIILFKPFEYNGKITNGIEIYDDYRE